MNRRTAIAALLTAVPGMVLADAEKRGATVEKKYKVATFAASLAPTWAQRELIVLHEDGMIETNLDNLRCLRVTFGGESVDISGAEIFDALKPCPRPSWNPRLTITDEGKWEVKP